MAAAFQSIGTGDHDRVSAADPADLNPGDPSGVVSGDLLVLCINVSMSGNENDEKAYGTGGSIGWEIPEGWIHRIGQSYWYDNGRVHLLTRVADGSALDSPTIVHYDTNCTGDIRAVIMRIDGQHASTFWDDEAGAEDGSSPITHPDVIASGADPLAIVLGGSYFTETGTYTFGNSFTERFSNGTNDAMWVGTKDVGSGAVGTTDVTCSTTLIRSGALSAVIAPAAGGAAANPKGVFGLPLHGCFGGPI